MKVATISLFWLIKGILPSIVIKYPEKMNIEGIRSLETHSIPTEVYCREYILTEIYTTEEYTAYTVKDV